MVNISVRTLRFYETLGLLLPVYVDKFTGYRYYNKESILECKFIDYLKKLGFSLKEILAYKINVSEEMIDKNMKKQKNKFMY